jgi:hypothetical protein
MGLWAYELLDVAARRRAIACRAGLALFDRETTINRLFRAALALEPSLVNHRDEFIDTALWALSEAVRYQRLGPCDACGRDACEHGESLCPRCKPRVREGVL